MPSSWEERRLGDIATLRRGLSYTSAQLDAGGVPFINLKSFGKGGGYRPGGLKTYSGPQPADLRLRPGDLLIANTDLTRDGSVVGAPALAPDFGANPAFFSMDASRVEVAAAAASTSFLFYRLQLQDVRSFMQARAGGSTVLHLHLKDVPALRLLLPPLPEQRRIATILDTLDEAIRKTEEVIAKLERVKQGLLHDLLTRGIDHNGELRDPERHPEQFKDSPLGRIPTEWALCPIRELSDISSGTTPSRAIPAYWVDGEIPWVKTGEVNFKVINSTEECVSKQALAGGGLRLYPVGTVLVAMYGQGQTRGRVGLLGQPATTNQACAALQPFGDKCRPVYLFEFLRWSYERLRATGQGSHQSNLNAGIVGDFPVRLPPVSEQQRIEAVLRSFGERLDRETDETNKLRLMKNGLMDDLLTGRVRVSTTAGAIS